jgi:toxin ParE1/3/4
MTYKVVHHPLVDDDVWAITRWLERYAVPENVAVRLQEIGDTALFLAEYPNAGTLRSDIATGQRAVATGTQGVIAFVVNEDDREVLILSITYAGADWLSISRARLSNPR